MPLPDRLARINRRVTNPLARSLAGRLPPFAVVVHRGRTSGRVYRTPVMAFPAGDGLVIALTYGPDRDWVKNVLAEGGCALVRGGREIRLDSPEVVDERVGLPLMPAPVRPAMRLLGVSAFLRLRPASADTPGAAGPGTDGSRRGDAPSPSRSSGV
jgi:deazaflavin-dependent oxidoreductase (nitroreductase family)